MGQGITNPISERVANSWFHAESAVVYNNDWLDRVPGSLNSQLQQEKYTNTPLIYRFFEILTH